MLSSRGSKITKLLIENPRIKIAELEQLSKLTRRQINYSLDAVNSQLKDAGIAKIQRTHQGQFLIAEDTRQYLQSLLIVEKVPHRIDFQYRTEQQRLETILLYIGTSFENISLINLYDYLQVSKTTVVADIHAAEQLVRKYQLAIRYSRKEGYLIEGDERKIRMLLNELTEQLLRTPLGIGDIDALSSVKIEPVIHFVHEIELQLGVTYSDDAFQYITRMLQVVLTRDRSQKVQDQHFFEQQVDDVPEYLLVKKKLPKGWQFSESSTEWLTLIFLTGNTLHNQTSNRNDQLSRAVSRMVSQFEKLTYVFIPNRNEFEQRLLLHLRPAFFRVKYQLPIKDLGIQNIIRNNSSHRLLVKTIQQIITPIERLAGRDFPTDEIELISFYFGSELQDQTPDAKRKQRAAVVCSNGLIVAKIMYESLRQLFPEISFLSASSVREFQNYQHDFDIVFTTIPLKTKIRQFVVSPVMNSRDRINLRFRVLTEIGSIDANLDQLMKIVADDAEIKNRYKLQTNLRRYLLSQNTDYVSTQTDTSQLPALLEYLTPQRIQVVHEPVDWTHGIRLAGNLLISNQKVTEQYLDTILQVTDSPKNYSFLGSHMAIPHASPEDGVQSDGFSIVVLKIPTQFPGQHQICMIVMLAIKDSTKHLRAIQQLDYLASHEHLFKQVLKQNSADSVFNTIKNLTLE